MKKIFSVLEKYKKNEEEITSLKKNIQDIIFFHTKIFIDFQYIYIKKNSLYIETSSLKKTIIFQKKDLLLEDFKKNKIQIFLIQ
jgi:putative ribosome biogenesis GTPase RsgA